MSLVEIGFWARCLILISASFAKQTIVTVCQSIRGCTVSMLNLWKAEFLAQNGRNVMCAFYMGSLGHPPFIDGVIKSCCCFHRILSFAYYARW
ncbi:hypothetical protein ANCCAN_30301 [Ancylostoma caninum]|uniref:Secreted protein n=1 Tax=Ancylostoma caninum TaxID=29170 RepID=A0A368EZ41_ANCCA|nr:hypothetical protein ANCCAN_30301 [Ancylostoma caninum]